MPKYQVFFLEEADEEVLRSYEWGLVFWGEERAKKWLFQLYDAVITRLSEFPLSCQVARESEFLDIEVRQDLFGRYRILFQVEKDEVTVLRLIGPHANRPDASDLDLD